MTAHKIASVNSITLQLITCFLHAYIDMHAQHTLIRTCMHTHTHIQPQADTSKLTHLCKHSCVYFGSVSKHDGIARARAAARENVEAVLPPSLGEPPRKPAMIVFPLPGV